MAHGESNIRIGKK